MCSVVSTLRAGSEGELVQIRPPQPKFLLLNHFRNPAPIRICMPQRRAIDKFSVCPYSVQTPSQARRSLPTSRLPITNRGKPASDHFRFADNSEVILPLRTEGVVIMLWPITDHSSAARVPDNDHPAL